MHRRRGVRRRRIEPTGDRHLGNRQCKRFESNEAKTDSEETKRKRGAETLVTTRKTSRNAAETLPGQEPLPASRALRTLPFNSWLPERACNRPTVSRRALLRRVRGLCCGRRPMRLGMVVIRVVRQLRFQGCREAPGVVWDEACRGHILPPHGRSRAGCAGTCWEVLGNEPNQRRVISRNHSMKSKLGTVRVWTRRAEEELVETRTLRLRMSLLLVCFGIGASGWSGVGFLVLGASWCSGCLVAHHWLAIPSPTYPHHMQT